MKPIPFPPVAAICAMALITALVLHAEANSFAGTAAMATPRANHTATLLQDGKVLVAGGYFNDTTGNIYPTTVQIFDPQTGTWAATGNMRHGRAHHTATRLPNGKVLVVGGYNYDGTAPFQQPELFDPVTGTWSDTAPIGVGGNDLYNRYDHTATLLADGRVLVAGGGGTLLASSIGSAKLFDPTTGTWTTTSPMNSARGGHTASLLPDGRVLVEGGMSQSSYATKYAEVYDPATGAWAPAGDM